MKPLSFKLLDGLMIDTNNNDKSNICTNHNVLTILKHIKKQNKFKSLNHTIVSLIYYFAINSINGLSENVLSSLVNKKRYVMKVNKSRAVVIDGVEYSNTNEASVKLGLKYSTVRYRIKSTTCEALKGWNYKDEDLEKKYKNGFKKGGKGSGKGQMAPYIKLGYKRKKRERMYPDLTRSEITKRLDPLGLQHKRIIN